MEFLINLGKELLELIVLCVGLGIVYLVFVITREVGWLIQQENRKQYREKQEEKNNATGSI